MPYPTKDVLERVKLTLEIVTPIFLVLLLVVALCNRANLGRYIKEFEDAAQIRLEELQLLGIKAKLTHQVDSARDLSDALKDMVTRRDKAVELLKCQVDASCTAAQATEMQALLRRPETPPAIVATLQRSQETVAASERVIAKADSARASPATDWIVIAGADGRPADAKDEINSLRRLFPNNFVEALKRGSWYRTVVHFSTSEEAMSQVGAITTATGRKPYVRRLSEWCERLVKETDDVRRCTPPAAG